VAAADDGDDVAVTGDGDDVAVAGDGDDVATAGDGDDVAAAGDRDDIAAAGDGDDVAAARWGRRGGWPEARDASAARPEAGAEDAEVETRDRRCWSGWRRGWDAGWRRGWEEIERRGEWRGCGVDKVGPRVSKC
jgi:Ca2+-binding RTX toxin-like protein